MARVLIVEDDESMAAALKEGFEYEGYTVAVARDGEEGLKLVQKSRPDLMILDVMLPRMSGLDVCKQVRAEGNTVPIIMLTARGQEIDKVLGLKLGADDYLTKPFGFMELLARVAALLRRSAGKDVPAEAFRFGNVEVDFKKSQVRKGSRKIEMSPRELRLLRFFVEHRGEVIPREQLLDAVWDYDNAPLTRTVDMHVAKLRRKLEDKPADPQFIVTVHGIGYKFNG